MRGSDDVHSASDCTKASKWSSMHNILSISITIAVLVICFTIIIVKLNLMQNVENRALMEVESTTEMQELAYKSYMDEQFQALRLTADMLENGRHFASEGIQLTLRSIMRTFYLVTFCMADMDGNAIDFQGNDVGNCSDREYFQEIADGSDTQVCEYITEIRKSSESEIVLAVPVYDENGKMANVLFCGKESTALEEAIFGGTSFDSGNFSIYLCDESGQVITANEKGYNFLKKYNNAGDGVMNINDLGESMQRIYEARNARCIEINGETYFAKYTAVDECGWGIYCLVSETDVRKAYSENIKRVQNIIMCIASVFGACIVYVLVLVTLYRRRKGRETRLIQQYNENYRYILCETHCAVVEVDLDTKHVTTIQENFGDVKVESLHGPMDEYFELKKRHPEFDFDELETGIEIVKQQKKSCTFETILSAMDGAFYWLKAKLIPIMNEKGRVNCIYCVMFDISDLHSSHETVLDTYAKIPGAIHRHCLSDPIHLNYYSDRLCKMLGYTRIEIDEIIGDDYQYSNLILQDDREKFIAFTEELAKKGGSQTCEYRMVCKDGTTIEVSEIMETKTAASGIVYGYAVVTDLCKYREEQKELQRELETTRENLVQSRMQNAGSQMQPHFLYNALASIREIILDDPEYASDLVYDFTTHLRACIRAMSNGALVPFSQELENVNAYVNIEKMRFGDKLQVEYDCQITAFDIIQLSIQPLVENAIRHGIFQRGMSGGKVLVRSFQHDGNIIVCVEDNGTGFDYDAVLKEVKDGTRDSSGLASLTYRFETMMNACVTVESKIGSGTKVTVAIPDKKWVLH